MTNVLSHAVTGTDIIGRENIGDNDFHIALTGTPDYISHMGMVMLSAVRYNPDVHFAFHFFTNHLPEEERKRLTQASDMIHLPIYVHLVDDAAFRTLLLSDGTAAFFYRFLIPPALLGTAGRVLYLDGDMMCRGPIDALAGLDMQGKYAAVVSDRREKENAGRVGTSRYFNAGMMLIDVDRWMEDGLFDRIVSMAQENVKKVGRRLSHHDQDIQNQLLDGNVLFIEKKYNYLYNLDLQSLFAKQPQNEPAEKQSVIHFAGHAKPWHSWVQNWPIVREYEQMRLDSPWKDVPLVPPRGGKNLHQAARTARKDGAWGHMAVSYLHYLAAKMKHER